MQTATQNGVTLASTTSSQEELNRALQGTEATENPSNQDSSNQASSQISSAAGIDQAESEPASDTGTAESEPEQGKARGKGGFQRRIDRLTKEKTQALELAGQERQARLQLEAKLAGKPAGAPQATHAGDQVDPKPSEEQFDTWEDYTEGLTRWAVRQEAKAQKQKELQADAEQAANQSLRETFDAHNKRLNSARRQYEDWEQVAQSLEDGGAIPQSVGLAMIELDNGPAVMYHLAKNPGLLAKLNDMSEVRAVAEIGRIAASLGGDNSAGTAFSDTSSPESWPMSAAPAPIKPVGGSATKAATDPSRMPLADYIKWRNGGGGR